MADTAECFLAESIGLAKEVKSPSQLKLELNTAQEDKISGTESA